ncbi:hypothetical protein XM38_033360 [Halomicronema hongdechloris C2206]|uniref:Uncharacterized protein n=1 Tax=Halomicronema hongdechloris C2206 TaxID=1641165 RepID=A0A1Z3HQ05_9CYAN|nr:DUF4912 domain-containing protein [Halomicronema hongdechloris]ASC72379.1 hypothetical protein XM38_033360 [Halomicronema hongdechloris C2206]
MAQPQQVLLAQWTLPDLVRATLCDRKLPLGLRLYDATAIDLDRQPAHAVYDYPCEGLSSLRITAPVGERDYVAELGYYTPEGQWHGLVRSLHQRASITEVTESAHATDAPEAISAPVEPASFPPAPSLPRTPLRVGCQQHLTIDSQQHSYGLDAEQTSSLEQVATTTSLVPGTYLIGIEKGGVSCFGNSQFEPEPWVLVWLHGGQFILHKTGVETTIAWVVLNGYADTLTLDVLEPTQLSALVVDTQVEARLGQISLLILPDADA